MGLKSRYFFGLVLLMFILSAVFIMFGHSGFASRFLGISFWVLVLGITLYIWEVTNEK